MRRLCIISIFFAAVMLFLGGQHTISRETLNAGWKLIAWSKKRGVEIFVKQIDGIWCHQFAMVRLLIEKPLVDEGVFQDLIAKLGNKMLSDCNNLRYLAVEVLSNSASDIIYRGEAMALDGWILNSLSPQQKNQLSNSPKEVSLPAELDDEGSKVADLLSIASRARSASHHSGMIAQIQVLLKHLGLYAGAANGELDQQTRSSIRAFQLASNIKATGSPDRDFFRKALDPLNIKKILNRKHN